MKRLLITTFATLCILATSLVAQTKSHRAEIYVEGNTPLKVLSKQKNTYVGKAVWHGKNADNFITATTLANSDDWKEIGLTFESTKDAILVVSVRTNFMRDKNGMVADNLTLVKDFMINGKLAKTITPQNPNGAAVTFGRMLSAKLEVKKGEKIELSAMVKVPDDSWGNKQVDLSKYANISASKDLKSPISFKNGISVLNGIRFNLLDSNMAFNPSKMKGGKLEIIPNDKDGYPYMYVLANVDDKIDFNYKACASIHIQYSTGEQEDIWIRKDRDFGRSFDKMDTTKKALKVKLEGSSENAGSVYMMQNILKSRSPIVSIKIIGGLNIFAITFSNKDRQTIQEMKLDMSQWKVVDMKNLEIKDGSALDVADGIGKTQAGRYGYVKVGKSGRFEFEKMPNKPVRFKGTNWRPGDMFGRGIKTHADIDELAKMTRKQGYNLVRWRLSMRKDEFKAPYQLDEFNKDLYDYFFFAFAREGVYHHFNLSSHDLGNPDFQWGDRFNVKILMLFGDTKTREDWRKLMHYQLNLVNKYTGKKWKDDPSIVSTEYYNEIELGPNALGNARKEVKAFVDAKFVEYLKRQYKTVDDLKKSDIAGVFKNIKKFEDAKASVLPADNPDYARFVIENGRNMQQFCEKVIREEIGFKAPLHQHNCARSTHWALLSAEAGDYTALNVYHHHPSRFMSKGSYISNTSSVSDFGSYFLAAVSKRVADRPMMLSEWQHCYWNPYTHEAGVLFPAYSAFQGFDNLTVHDVAIIKKAGAMGCFEVGRSPIFRANEFLSYSMFYRGDVTTTKNRVDVVYDKKYLETDKHIGKAMNREQSKIALMTGFAIDFPDARKTPTARNIKSTPAVLKIKPNGASDSWSAANFVATGKSTGEYRVSDTEKILRQKGILKKDNITDSENGVFQSDTGEIVMRVKEKLVKVVTEKTEAITLVPETKNEKLGRATLVSTSVPASFAVVSVDNKPISSSQRMVVIYNTDNLMTDFKVTPDRETLISQGRPPVLMLTGKLSATLKVPTEKQSVAKRILSVFKKKEAPKQYALYALKINGERMQKLPLEIKDGEFLLNIDTSKMAETTPFFELVAE